MADNVGYTPGTGATVAADDIGGVLFQRVKATFGTDGVATDVSASDPLPVTVGNFPATQAVTGTFWQATQPVSGPLTNTELRASAIATVENATVYTGAAAQTATVNNILESVSGATGTACENVRSGAVQVVSTGTGGTFIFEQSIDNTNWVALPVFNAALVTGVPITAAITATASAIIYTFPVRARFNRLRIATTITGGSIQAHSRFSTEPWTPAAFLVASNTAANLLAQVSGTVTANIGTGSLAAGTNAIGDVGVQVRANATGAASASNYASPATPAGGSIKGSAGRLFGWQLANTSTGVRWVKLFNQTAVTMGTTAAAYEFPIPAGGIVQASHPAGIGHGTGIFVAVTAARGLTDNTATGLALGDVSGAFIFA